MRSYPRNSPEAAARIVALVLVADGHVCRSEIESLQEQQIDKELGLAPGRFAEVMHSLCEDLLVGSQGHAALMFGVDEQTLAALMAEVQDPALQRSVLRLAAAAAEADQHLADAETLVMAVARTHWRPAADSLAASSTPNGTAASADRPRAQPA